ncbi:MAG: hypothetical protein ACFFBP_11410 [Promethearchaeota archaeon]
METITRVEMDQLIGGRVNNSDAEFRSEFLKGYLWAEIDKQEQFIEKLSQELKSMKNRDSFDAQYLETWIESLKIDLEKEKQLLK